MIKIIKNGVKPKKYKYIYFQTCPSCTCKFEFEKSDCTNIRNEKCTGGEDIGEISCPFCSESLVIDFRTTKHKKEEITEEQNNSGSRHTITSNIDDFYQWSPSLCKCPNCGSINTLISDSSILKNLLPQYDFRDFKCKDCGFRWTGLKQASISTKLYTPWDNGHCDKCPNKNFIGDSCYSCPYYPFNLTCNREVKK